MKQLGNLAIVCARRPDVLMQIHGGMVSVHVGQGPERAVLSADWENDAKISSIVQELSFGRYSTQHLRKEVDA